MQYFKTLPLNSSKMVINHFAMLQITGILRDFFCSSDSSSLKIFKTFLIVLLWGCWSLIPGPRLCVAWEHVPGTCPLPRPPCEAGLLPFCALRPSRGFRSLEPLSQLSALLPFSISNVLFSLSNYLYQAALKIHVEGAGMLDFLVYIRSKCTCH